MDVYNKKKTPEKKPPKMKPLKKKTPKKKLLKKKKTPKKKTPSPTVEEVVIEEPEPEPVKKTLRRKFRKFRKFPKMRTRKVHFDEVVDSILLQKKEKPKPTINVQNKPLVFGRVYSEYCHFCRDMKGQWKKVCKNSVSPINDMGDPYEKKVEKFNTTYPNANLEVNGVPTIFRLMNEDSPVEYYSGPRTEHEMTKWIYG